MTKQSFIRGTFILSTGALITTLLGFINGVVLARLLGAEGIGLLMMAHPLLPFIITLTELGLPVAISKLVAEAEAQGNSWKVKRILIVSLTITGTLSVVLTLIALFGSKIVASIFLADQRAYYAMLAITPIAPIIAISAVLKGYYRGKQDMKPLAFSNVIENLIQISCIMALVQFLIPYGIEYAAAGAMISAVIGEAAGLLYLISKYKWFREKNGIRSINHDEVKKDKRTIVELLKIGLPTTGHGFIYSIYSAFQPMLVTKSLAMAGIGTAAATKQFGLLVGYAFPLLFLPSFITHSLSTALVPAISEAGANKNGLLMHRRMDLAMQVSLIVGAPCTVILFIWATPLTTLIYNAPEAGNLLRILAPVFFLYYFEVPLHAVLLGLGKANTIMWNVIVATIFKAAAIVIFGAEFGIYGVAVGINCGMLLLTMLNFFSISSVIGFYLDIRQFFKVLFCMALMAFCGIYTFSFMQSSGYKLIWGVLGSVSASLLIYIIALLITNTIKRNDARKIPVIRRMVSPRK